MTDINDRIKSRTEKLMAAYATLTGNQDVSLVAQYYKNLQLELAHTYTVLDQLKKTPQYDTQAAQTLRGIVDRARATLDDRKDSLPGHVQVRIETTPRPAPMPPPNSLRVKRGDVCDVNAYARLKEHAAHTGQQLWFDED